MNIQEATKSLLNKIITYPEYVSLCVVDNNKEQYFIIFSKDPKSKKWESLTSWLGFPVIVNKSKSLPNLWLGSDKLEY